MESDVKVRLRLLSSLRQIVGESELEVEFAGGSVESLVKEAGRKNTQLGEAILAKDGGIDYSINVILNGRPLTEATMKEEMEDGDEVILLAAAAGG
ncbi:MAG: MoaD/ThiS family protein [Thermoplasmata archaeon]